MEFRIFRLLVVFSTLIASLSVCHYFWHASEASKARRDEQRAMVYAEQWERDIKCERPRCEPSIFAPEPVNESLKAAYGFANLREWHLERARLARWPMFGVAVAIFLFYAVRFALTGRLQPVLPWRLP